MNGPWFWIPSSFHTQYLPLSCLFPDGSYYFPERENKSGQDCSRSRKGKSMYIYQWNAGTTKSWNFFSWMWVSKKWAHTYIKSVRETKKKFLVRSFIIFLFVVVRPCLPSAFIYYMWKTIYASVRIPFISSNSQKVFLFPSKNIYATMRIFMCSGTQ